MCITLNLTAGLNSTHMQWCQEICENDWIACVNLILIFCPKGILLLFNAIHRRKLSWDESKIISHLSSKWSLPLGYELTLWSAFSLLPALLIHPSLHSCSIQGEGERTNHMFQGGILNGQDPRPKYLQLSCPLASLSSTLSLRTGLDDLCWKSALCWRRMGAEGEGHRVKGRSEKWCHIRSGLEVGQDLCWQEWCCLWASGQEKTEGEGTTCNMINRTVCNLCVCSLSGWVNSAL